MLDRDDDLELSPRRSVAPAFGRRAAWGCLDQRTDRRIGRRWALLPHICLAAIRFPLRDSLGPWDQERPGLAPRQYRLVPLEPNDPVLVRGQVCDRKEAHSSAAHGGASSAQSGDEGQSRRVDELQMGRASRAMSAQKRRLKAAPALASPSRMATAKAAEAAVSAASAAAASAAGRRQ